MKHLQLIFGAGSIAVLAFLSVLFFTTGMSHAANCGGLNQKACPTWKKGSRCDRGLTNVNGRCIPCGSLNQRACPALNRGARCNGKLVNVRGICRRIVCGGLNQTPCKKNIRPRPCDRRLGAFQGRCQRKSKNPGFCGSLGQPSCLKTIRFRACDRGLQLYGGRCVKPAACGLPKLPACSKHVRVPACTTGYKPNRITKICDLAVLVDAQDKAIEIGRQCYRDFKSMSGAMLRYAACQKRSWQAQGPEAHPQ